ncbi:MAG: replication factor C small subunit [Candidatus Aenigmarchaeota archaeon]|nr:replication factor C small subunit [Candidatus Aenigmarchaeota archaeon]
MSDLWVEKYRPQKLSEIRGQTFVVERLQHFVTTKSLPHCLFTGPAGCGKTTAALAIANEMFENQWHSNFLELNASDERGIDTIRNKVKDFARTVPINGLFKIIYLDEADSLTKDAQHALRRTMENYSHVCRFLLACNYAGKIIAPIQSRTAVFRFSKLSENDVVQQLHEIAQKERLSIDDEALHAICNVSEGDLRKAITLLQTAATTTHITQDHIFSVAHQSDPHAVKTMIELAWLGNFPESRQRLRSFLYDQGLSGEDIIKQMHETIYGLSLPDLQKLELFELLGEYEFRLTEGSNPQIQLEALLAQITRKGNIFKTAKKSDL